MMKPRELLLPFGVLSLLGAVLAGYYLQHKPPTFEQATHIFNVLADLAAALCVTILAGGLGTKILQSSNNQSANLALPASLGFGLLGFGVLFLGLLGLINLWLVLGILVTLALWLWRAMWQWVQAAWQAAVGLGQGGAFNKLCAALVWLALALGLLQALAPPLRWDALTYHLTLPKWYAELGHLRVDANYLFTGMPQLNEMLFTLAFILRNEQAAQTLGWCFGAVLALALAQLSAEVNPTLPPALAPAILFSALTIAISLAWAYAEMLMMLCTVALLATLREWARTPHWHWLVLAGVFAGLVMGGKYTSVIVPLGALGYLFASSFLSVGVGRGVKAKSFLLNSLVFGLSTLLTFLPWLFKNTLFTGNLVYPLVFPTETMEAARLWFYNRPDRINQDVLAALTIFPRAVLFGAQSQNEYDATLGPIWLIWPFLLAFGWRRLAVNVRRELWPLIAFSGAAYVGWVALMFISQYAIQARLFFALFPTLAMLAVAGQAALHHLDSAQLRISFIVHVLLILTLLVSAAENVLYAVRLNPLPYVFGVQSASAYREGQFSGYEAVMRDVNALPENSRVQFLWETWGLGCATYARCVPDMVIDGWFTARHRFGSASNILAEWRRQGITHVLIFETGLNFVRSAENHNVYTAEDWEALQKLRAQLTVTKDYANVYTLYALP